MKIQFLASKQALVKRIRDPLKGAFSLLKLLGNSESLNSVVKRLFIFNTFSRKLFFVELS